MSYEITIVSGFFSAFTSLVVRVSGPANGANNLNICSKVKQAARNINLRAANCISVWQNTNFYTYSISRLKKKRGRAEYLLFPNVVMAIVAKPCCRRVVAVKISGGRSAININAWRTGTWRVHLSGRTSYALSDGDLE